MSMFCDDKASSAARVYGANGVDQFFPQHSLEEIAGSAGL
jgi:hypothetical protein